MPLTLNTKSYTMDTQRSVDSIRYNGPSHTISDLDILDCKRTPAKPTADYAGQSKASTKMTRSMESSVTAGVTVGNGIFEFSISVPVESKTVDQEAGIDDLATWLLTAEAKTVLLEHDINH